MNDTEKMDIVVQSSGIDTTNQQFKELINTIINVTSQVGKLSSKISGLMRNFSKLSKTTSPINKQSSRKPIIKKADNRLNVGDMANWYSGKVYNPTYKLYSEDLSKVNNQIKSISNNSKQSSKQIKTFNETIKSASKNSETASDKLWKFTKRIKSLTYSIYMAKSLANVINDIVQESGTWIENLNLFAVTFGESNYRDALNWATDYAEKLGLANNEIVKMTGYFKQLSTAIGITGEQGDQLSQILVQLGYDFGSFYNISFGSAFEKLQSGIFSGQVRTLRTIGIDVSQTAIQNLLDTNKALSSLGASATQLTQMQKVLARTILTMQAGTNAFGDLSRSIDTLQNRVRVLQASMQNLKLALGDIVSEYAREFVAYGIAITQVITSILRVIQPLKSELEYDIGDTVFTEITDEAEDAEKAINQLPFDKFISLTSGDDEQVNLTEALNQLLQEQIEKYEQISSQFDGIDEKVESIKNAILKWVFPNTTLEQISNMVSSLGNGATLIEKFKVVLSEMNPTIQSVVGIFIDLISLIKAISPALSKVSSSILKVVSALVELLDKTHLLIPLIYTIFALKIFNKISNLFSGINILAGSIGGKLSPVLRDIYNAFTKTNGAVLKYSQTLQQTVQKTEGLVKSTQKLKLANQTAINSFSKSSKAVQQQKISFESLGLAVGSIVSALASISFAVTSIISNWNNMSDTAKSLTIIVGVLTAVFASLAFAVYASTMQWAKAISVAGGVIATGTAVMTAISGFENGGIPKKSELFYMNENGVPEALINTGGSQTNVINIEQLSEGMRRGFVQAIQDTGLNRQKNVNVTLSPNSDSNFARALFPSLKKESKRLGGNQL